jgi:hypothetical protein
VLYALSKLVREDPPGMADRAMAVLAEMRARGITPDLQVYRHLFRCLKQVR